MRAPTISLGLLFPISVILLVFTLSVRGRRSPVASPSPTVVKTIQPNSSLLNATANRPGSAKWRPTNQSNGTVEVVVPQPVEAVGIRVRFNEPVFSDLARVFNSVFAYQVRNARIASYQQCFPEGCFYLHSFRVTGFERPREIQVKPEGPNKLVLKIVAFDIDILGGVTGNIQILLNVPILGQILVNARQITVTAAFDIQKDLQRTPYLHQHGCNLEMGVVNAQVNGMGLITDSVNLKYKREMTEKAKEIIAATVCWNLEKAVQNQVNTRLRDMPRSLSVYELLQYFDGTPSSVEPQPRPILARDPGSQFTRYRTFYSNFPKGRRFKRESVRGRSSVVETTDLRRKQKAGNSVKEDTVDYLDYAEESDRSKTTEVPRTTTKATPDLPTSSGSISRRIGASTKEGSAKNFKLGNKSVDLEVSDKTTGIKEFIDGFELGNIARLFLSLDFVDSAASSEQFVVGISGAVQVNSQPYSGPYTEPRVLHNETALEFSDRIPKRAVEMIVGEFTPNSLFNQAHRAKILRMHLSPSTPHFGQMLKTTCTADEVCISDAVPEIGEKYPGKQLHIIIESVRPPKVAIGENNIRVNFIGLALFFVAELGNVPIGKIPFSALTKVELKNSEDRIDATLTIPELEILEDVDFFELPPESLRGFKKGVQRAIERLAEKHLRAGLDKRILEQKFAKYGMDGLNIQLTSEGVILLQADVDVYKLLFEDETLDARQG